MIFHKKIAALFLLLIVLSLLSSCNTANVKTNTISLPDYSEVVALESKQNSGTVFSIKDDKLIKTGDGGSISEIEYNSELGIYVSIQNTGYGNNLVQNNIDILKKTGESKINNFFSASDIELSPKATKIAFRTYKNDSLESAEGMKIYNLNKGQYADIKSQVLVSGNLYKWLNDNEIMYYGISDSKDTGGEIFKYNLINNSETVALKQINGYCTFFMPLGNDILYLEKSANESNLYYYNTETDKKELISADLGDIWNAVVDKSHNSVYLIASKINETDCSIYKVEPDRLSIQRITYDFPQKVEKDGGMALNSKGELYFCGILEGSKNPKNDVFSYNIKDASINLISYGIHTGTYRIFSSNSLKQP